MSETNISYSMNKSSGSFQDFIESNSLIAKFVFLLLVIFIFMIVLKIGVQLLNWYFQPSDSPRLIDGMVDAKQMLVFHQDPNSGNRGTIYRSVNETKGIEFTWSVWIYIENLQYLEERYKHVFYKGNSNLEENGLNFPNNCPGLYIAPHTNSLVVMMNTYNVINEEITIPDIPLNKWVNVIIRCKNTTLDVYINGTITRSVQLSGVPKQNYGDVFVAANGGFDGKISNLWYYNYALGTADIQNISNIGPNTTIASSSGLDLKNNDYLSLRWFYAGSGDMYNPTLNSK